MQTQLCKPKISLAGASLGARAAALIQPRDHLPATVHDRDTTRRDDAIQRRRAMYATAKAASEGLRTALAKQRKGGLTKSDMAVLAELVRLNLYAAVRGEPVYRPGRRALATAAGVSEATVKRSLAKFKAAGLIAVARYAKGGRLGDKGHGLATEFATGCLHDLDAGLAALGYRLPRSLAAELADLAAWADEQVKAAKKPTGSKAADAAESPILAEKPTGSNDPAVKLERDNRPCQDRDETPADVPGMATAVPVAGVEQPDHEPRPETGANCPVSQLLAGEQPGRDRGDATAKRPIRPICAKPTPAMPSHDRIGAIRAAKPVSLSGGAMPTPAASLPAGSTRRTAEADCPMLTAAVARFAAMQPPASRRGYQ